MYLDWEQFLSVQFLGNTAKQYLIAVGAFIVALIALRIFEFLVMKKLRKIVDHTITKFDNILLKSVERILSPSIYFLIGLYASTQFIEVPNFMEKGIRYITLITLIYYATKGIQDMIEYGVERMAQKKGSEADASVTKLLNKVLKVVLWIIAFLLILSNLGYNISSLIAGLGVGGIAIAFAIQNILQDLFSSFSIYFDKPFEIGDFIIIGNDMGTVEKIGLKSTRLRTLEGEELIISNQELTKARVHNYKRMEQRRVTFSFGVTYDTPSEKLSRIPGMVKEIIDKIDLAETDRVVFTEFGDFSLKFETVYHVDTPDKTQALKIQEQINLKIKERFEENNIEMAFPTQTIQLQK